MSNFTTETNYQSPESEALLKSLRFSLLGDYHDQGGREMSIPKLIHALQAIHDLLPDKLIVDVIDRNKILQSGSMLNKSSMVILIH